MVGTLVPGALLVPRCGLGKALDDPAYLVASCERPGAVGR